VLKAPYCVPPHRAVEKTSALPLAKNRSMGQAMNFERDTLFIAVYVDTFWYLPTTSRNYLISGNRNRIEFLSLANPSPSQFQLIVPETCG
jgi:hypothetical protein